MFFPSSTRLISPPTRANYREQCVEACRAHPVGEGVAPRSGRRSCHQLPSAVREPMHYGIEARHDHHLRGNLACPGPVAVTSYRYVSVSRSPLEQGWRLFVESCCGVGCDSVSVGVEDEKFRESPGHVPTPRTTSHHGSQHGFILSMPDTLNRKRPECLLNTSIAPRAGPGGGYSLRGCLLTPHLVVQCGLRQV